MLVGLAVQLVRRSDLSGLELVAGALFVGGGFGNLVDRAARGSVIDFVVIGRGRLSTNVFNVADVALVAGVVLFLVASLRRRPAAEERRKDEPR